MPEATVTTASQEVIPSGVRKVLILQNFSDSDIYIRTSGPVAVSGANAGIRIKAGGGSVTISQSGVGDVAPNKPIFAMPMPGYGTLDVVVPPVLRI